MKASSIAIMLTFAILTSMTAVVMTDDQHSIVSAAQSCDYTYGYYTDSLVYLTGYTGPGGAVVIPSEIAGMPVRVLWKTFLDCTSVTSVTIPNSVIYLNGGVFSGCTSLTSVTIPNSVVIIGPEDFNRCTSLTSVTIPNSVTQITGSEFTNCTSLTNITIGRGVQLIGPDTFRTQAAMTNITFNGDAPTGLFHDWIDPAAVTIYYHQGSSGFTTPIWQGAPTYPLATASLPSAPEYLKAVSGPEKVMLNWSTPVNDGGAVIDYYAIYQDGVMVMKTNSSPVTLTNLSIETSFTFSVLAHNSVGYGKASASVSVVPSARTPIPSTDWTIPMIAILSVIILLLLIGRMKNKQKKDHDHDHQKP